MIARVCPGGSHYARAGYMTWFPERGAGPSVDVVNIQLAGGKIAVQVVGVIADESAVDNWSCVS